MSRPKSESEENLADATSNLKLESDTTHVEKFEKKINPAMELSKELIYDLQEALAEFDIDQDGTITTEVISNAKLV